MVELDVFWDTKVFGHFVTQYCELRHETICIGKPTIPAFRCVKSQLAARPGNLCGEKSVSDVLYLFSGPNKNHKCSKRTKTCILVPKLCQNIICTAFRSNFENPHGQNFAFYLLFPMVEPKHWFPFSEIRLTRGTKRGFSNGEQIWNVAHLNPQSPIPNPNPQYSLFTTHYSFLLILIWLLLFLALNLTLKKIPPIIQTR